jgi:hypothetical protein
MRTKLWSVSSSARRPRRRSERLVRFAALGLILTMIAVLPRATATALPDSPDDLLRAALQRARQAGSYRVELDVQQTVSPEQAGSIARGLPRSESAHFIVAGYVGGPQKARFAIEPRRVSRGLQSNAPATAQEILIAADTLYERDGDRWVKNDGLPPLPGINTDALSLLSVARDVHSLEPVERLPGRFERVGFTLHSRDVLHLLLLQQGQVDEVRLALASASGPSFGGTGELWINESGLPARLVLNLELNRSGEEAYRTVTVSTADYSNFGASFAPDLFNPTISPLTKVSTSPIPGSGMTAEQLSQLALFLIALVITLGLCCLLMSGRSRLKTAVVSLIVIVALASPYAANAVRAMESPAASAAPGNENKKESEVVQMLQEARAIADRHRLGPDSPASVLLQDTADEDQDGLPNGYELNLGTNPFITDTDMDGLTDYQEATGTVCTVWIPDPEDEFGPFIPITQTIETNPLMADSNGDGLRDGDEFHEGLCSLRYDRPPSAWDDDNDYDGMPDGLDLSPYSFSEEMGGVGSYFELNDAGTQYNQKVYYSNPGSNLTFETLDSDPGIGAVSYPFYVELQVRADEQLMRAAFKKALEWPKDLEGNIRNNGEDGDAVLASLFLGEDLRSSGMLEVVPFLEATVEEADLPSLDAMQMYGITATKEISGCATDCTYALVIPLVPVERNGQVFALQAKALYNRVEGSTDFHRRWRDLRLKWAVQGDIVRQNEEGDFRPSPTGSYGLMVYDTPYTITGLRVSRQGGTAMFVAGAYPTGTPELFDDGPIALLRAGMEAQFLTGRLSIDEIGDRFDYWSSNASITETWGITHTYRIMYGDDFYYHHLDLALLDTMKVTTRNLLDHLYPAHDHTPTLILASEQRTSTINADDLDSPDFADLAINTCLKPLVTSRSLKLQTYRYDPTAGSTTSMVATAAENVASGDWVPLTLDEVLAKIQSEFDQAWPEIQKFLDETGAAYESTEELYNEALNIVKMATTSWHIGQTAVQKLGHFSLQDLEQALSDPQVLAWMLTESGHLPASYAQAVYFLLGVVDAGGPVLWLESQFSKLVSFVEGMVDTVGGFLDSSPGLTAPSEETLLSWTQTAVNVLNYLAVVTGIGALADIAEILTTVIEVYKMVRQLIDAVSTIISALQSTAGSGAQTAGAFLDMMLDEVQALANSMSVIGLILQVGMTWLGVAITLATNSLPPIVASTLVARAVVETIILVVIFAIASVIPFGWILVAVIAIVKLIQEIIGVTIDPISLFLDWFFGIEISRLSTILSTQTGDIQFEPLDPQGGIIAEDRFRFWITSTVTLMGKKSALNKSWAGIQIGYAADGSMFGFCTQNPVEFVQGLQKYDEYGYPVQTYGKEGFLCQAFRADVDIEVYDPNCNDPGDCVFVWKVMPSGYYTPRGPKTKVVGNLYWQNVHKYAYADFVPRYPRVNTWIPLDVSFNASTVNYVCSPYLDLIDECYEYNTGHSSPPEFVKLYFDILPNTPGGFWAWEHMLNSDPDGDGLEGYVDPATDRLVGPDTRLCATPSHQVWDADEDGLSDKFEYETPEVNPCKADSDSDGLDDGQELLLGTSPNDADTDDDGLRDGQELAHWDIDTKSLVAPWRIPLSSRYPGLPDPAAFPNPRHANLDGDHRTDKQEKHRLTSPNGFNPIPDDPVELTLDPQLIQGGGTRIQVETSPWPNDGPAAFDVELTVTLPVTFSNLSAGAGLLPPTSYPQLNVATPQVPFGPTTYTWSVPPIWLNRYLTATLAGVPTVPPGPVTVTAQLVFTHVGKLHVVTDALPLPVNLGGPTVTVDTPAPGAILPGGAVTITGLAQDPESVSEVYVCAKTQPSCSGADWQPTSGQAAWSYTWTPPADDVYYVQAYAVDGYGVSGPASTPITVSVDGTPPSGVQFDLHGTAYLSTTFLSKTLSTVRVTGRITDALGGEYVSGAGDAVLLVNRGPDAQTAHLKVQPADEPGALSSSFAYALELPYGGLGGVAHNAAGAYTLTVGATDRAGNAGPMSETLRVLIDDTPPLVYGRVPQVAAGTELTLTGRADDTALVRPRLPELPYTATMNLADSDATFVPACEAGQAQVVGDLNGDTIDDVVLVEHCAGMIPLPFRAGLFFGSPGAFTLELDIADADVAFVGETSGSLTFTPSAAGHMDVNGDSVGDLLLGDPSADSDEGRAYLILGRRGGGWPSSFSLDDADWVLSATGTSGFGGSVASAGDVDGDGLSDVLVGAADDGTRIGVAYLYLGRERGVPPTSSTLRSPHSIAAFTPAPPNLAGLGDTNGDGLSDFVVAYPGADAGAVALVHGRPQDEWPGIPVDLDTFADGLFTAPGTLQTVSPVGDVDADGLRDLLIGDPTAGVSRVFVLFGRRFGGAWPAPPAMLNLVTQADASYVYDAGSLGAGLTPMGDLDGDGRSDFAFGNPGIGFGPNRTAIVLAAHISHTLDVPVTTASFLITGSPESQRSGEYLSSGDINGDGVRDLLIGAPGDTRAYLLQGDFEPGDVSGVRTVQVGLYGPVADPTLPYTETLPSDWHAATLAIPGDDVTPWDAVVPLPGDGEYRAYGRAYDRAGNVWAPASWYLGDVWVNTSPTTMTGGSAALHPPDLVSKTHLSLAGAVTSTYPLQALRVYDGYWWYRQMPLTGTWSHDSDIPRTDLITLTFRAVARDAFGNTLHVSRTLTTDTLAMLPALSANLPANQWHTDVTPTLVVTWLTVLDGSTIISTWATIDTFSSTVPTAPVASNEVTRVLDAPGVYYGHVGLRDGAGNSRVTHAGPFLVNRTRTPSVILPDGWLDAADGTGEYFLTTLLNYDPYAAAKPAVLGGTWSADKLYLGSLGSPWGQYDRLSIYLDTQVGGISSTLAPFGVSHTLPFDADFAFVIGQESPPAARRYGLYQAGGGEWTEVVSPTSFAVTRFDTEIVLDRDEIGAVPLDTPVRLLAYAEDTAGVWAVLPASGRPTTTATISGTVAFVEGLEWPALGFGVQPNDGLDQVIAPVVQVFPGWDTALFSDTQTVMTVTVRNPDIGPYVNVPLTVTVGPTQPQQLMGLFGAPVGADCISCPVGARQWVLGVDVEAYGTQTVTLFLRTLVVKPTGVFPLPMAVSLGGSGLPGQPQPQVTAQYGLDASVATVAFVSDAPIVHVQPGEVGLGFFPGGMILGCWQDVEANMGLGFGSIGKLGDICAISGTLTSGESQVWGLRVRSDNGQLSTEVTKTLVADEAAPSVQITPISVLNDNYTVIQGYLQDEAPAYAQISIDGGKFFHALVSHYVISGALRAKAVAQPSAAWTFPVQLTNEDGEQVQVVARAIDEAGNVSPASDPMTITLDVVGPVITVTQASGVMQGLVSDGSGVASVEVSLDGGVTFQPATLSASTWTFSQASWSGSRVGFAIVRARDVWDNFTHEVIVLQISKIYLPVVLRWIRPG